MSNFTPIHRYTKKRSKSVSPLCNLQAIANEITNILEQHQGCLTAAKLGSKIARRDAGVLFRAKALCGGLLPLLEMFPDQFHIEVRHPNIFVRIPSTASSSAVRALSRKKAARIAAGNAARSVKHKL